MGKLKLKNTVTIQQEKLLAEKEEKLQKEQKELQDVGQSLQNKEQEVVVNILCFCMCDYLQSVTDFLKCVFQRTWLDSTEVNSLFLFRKLVIVIHIPCVCVYAVFVCVYTLCVCTLCVCV